jgi:large subunit ribosomal protein L23
MRRRGRSVGYRADWKKAYVKLKAGEKVPDFAEI